MFVFSLQVLMITQKTRTAVLGYLMHQKEERHSCKEMHQESNEEEAQAHGVDSLRQQ